MFRTTTARRAMVVTSLLLFGGLDANASATMQIVGSVPFGSSQLVRQLAVNPNTDRVYSAGNYADPGLTVLDASSPTNPTVVTTISSPYNGGVTVNPSANRFYTSDGYGGDILTYSGATNQLIDTTPAAGCGGIFDFDPATNLVYELTECNDSVNVMDAGTDQLVGSLTGCCAVGELLRVNSATGRVYATNYFSSKVFGPSPSFAFVTTLPGTVLAANPATNRVYSWPGSPSTDLTVLDGTTHNVVATIPNGVGAGGAYEVGVTDEVANLVYILDTGGDRVIVIDGATNTVAGSLDLPAGVESRAVAVDSTKHRVYVVGGAYFGPKTLYVFANGGANASTQIQQAIATIQAYSPQPANVSSLLAKLQNTQNSVGAGNTTAACNQLGAFLNEVSAQSGKKLTSAQAQQLTTDANQIRATLGC